MIRRSRPLADLAVVVVNYGSHKLLEKNLQAVARHTPEAKVVVVDNYTATPERDAVARLAATNNWSLVTPDSNLGFGKGANAGVERAKALGARCCFLLNPDAGIDRASLLRLWEAVHADPMALVSPTVHRPDGSVWFGGADLYLETGRLASMRRRVPGSTERREPWLSGACLMMNLELWDRVGGFDEGYFLYWEDVDLSHRVRLAGGKLVTLPDAHAVHDEGGTHQDAKASAGGAKSGTYYYYNIRNRFLFAARHLDDSDLRRWKMSSFGASWEILLRGGRRQFLHPVGPLGAAVRGILDGWRLTTTERRPPRARVHPGTWDN
jgi:GT2 family glycosyltransferase